MLAWGVLVAAIVAAGILTDEWGQLLMRAVPAASGSPADDHATRLVLTGAFLSLVGSVASWFLVDRLTAIVIGLWVPSILAPGTLLNGSIRSATGRCTWSSRRRRASCRSRTA
jgi:hypothetical protein